MLHAPPTNFVLQKRLDVWQKKLTHVIIVLVWKATLTPWLMDSVGVAHRLSAIKITHIVWQTPMLVPIVL